MLQTSKEWFKPTHYFHKYAIKVTKYFVFLVSINITSNTKQYSKFHFPGQAVTVVPVGWMFR